MARMKLESKPPTPRVLFRMALVSLVIGTIKLTRPIHVINDLLTLGQLLDAAMNKGDDLHEGAIGWVKSEFKTVKCDHYEPEPGERCGVCGYVRKRWAHKTETP